MTPEAIHEKLNNMYEDKGSRNFINHMIKAYFPQHKAQKVWEAPTGKFRCAITNEPLFSIVDVLKLLNSEETKNAFMENMKSMVTEPEKPIKAMDGAIKEMLKNKKMGLTGQDTDTYISMPAYREFFNWLTNKIITGDKNINTMIRKMPDAEMMDKIEQALPSEKKDKIKAIRKEVQQSKVSTFGDLEVLQQLKAKLEAEEGK